MSDGAASNSATPDTGTLNDQVRDSVAQLQASLFGAHQPFAAAAAYQVVTHALGLALHNAVSRQQHSHILRTALTTAAASALLEGRTEQAEAVLKLAESALANPSLDDEIGQLQRAMSNLREELENTLAASTAMSDTQPVNTHVS